jgi:transcriptional regulator with XRE-family HTH domain
MTPIGAEKDAKARIGDALRAARVGGRVPKTALAARLGVSPSLVAQWEAGKSRPSPAASARLPVVLAEMGAPPELCARLAGVLEGSGEAGTPPGGDGDGSRGGRLDYGGDLAKPRRLAAALLQRLADADGGWGRFIAAYEVFHILAGGSNRGLVLSFLRARPAPAELRAWIDDLQPEDLRLLIHAAAYALHPAEYAALGTLRLSLPDLRGWGRVDDVAVRLRLLGDEEAALEE